LEFRILGAGSATPQITRNPAGSIVSIDNFLILIDCGEGTQFRLLTYKIKVSRIKYILISHLHGDHFFGLIGLLSSFNLQKRTDTLTIIGPPGLDEILTLQFKYSNAILNYKIDFVVNNPIDLSCVIDNESFKIEAFPLKHRIPCSGFKITKKASKRKILSDLLPLNFPISYFNLLKNGFDVIDNISGKTYKNADYTTGGSPTKTLAYCSDTIFDLALIDYILDVDLLYHEATFLDDMAERAQKTFHSTASQAATIAQKANARRLILSHFSSRYKTLDLFIEQARSIFPASFLAIEGENVIF
jgi:ribonuclease Z